MMEKNSRLKMAEKKYVYELQEWLTNPKNADLANEMIEGKLKEASQAFYKELIQDESECADFLSKGGVADELEFIPLIFEYFKSRKIYDAIKSNCEVAFSHTLFVESSELEQQRKEMLSNMEKCLNKLEEKI